MSEFVEERVAMIAGDEEDALIGLGSSEESGGKGVSHGWSSGSATAANSASASW